MQISPKLLVYLRVALVGATGVAIEDLGTLNADLEREAETACHPDLPGMRTAYHELMAVVRARYELQQTVGLPGEPLGVYTLPGRAQRQLVREVLEDYRDGAALALQAGGKMSDSEHRKAAARVEEITAFLGGEQPSEDGAAA